MSHLVASLLRNLDDGACALLAAASVLGAEFNSGLAAAVAGTSRDTAGPLSAAETCGLVTRQPDRPDLGGSRTPWSATASTRVSVRTSESRCTPPRPPRWSHWPSKLRNGAVRSPGTCSGRHQTRAHSGVRPAGPDGGDGRDGSTRVRGRGPVPGHRAERSGKRRRRRSGERAELLIELATAEYRAGQLAASLQHAVAAADTAERDGRLDLVGDAALVVRGIGHTPVALTLLGLCDRALADDGCPVARRARLLAQRASALAELGDLEAADAGSATAMTAAAAVGDPAAELDAIRARVAALSAPQHRAERLRLGTRAVELATPAGQPLAAVLGRVWRIDAAYQLLNLEAVDAEIAQIAQLAESTRLPLARWHLLRQQASRAALAGQLTVARDRSAEARRLAFRIQDPSGAGLSYVFAVWLAVLRGDAGEIPADFFDAAAAAPPIPIVRAPLARALFAVGRIDEAQAVYETLRELPAAGDKDIRTFGALTQLMDLIIAFGDREMARATYDLIHPHVNDSGATGTGLVFLSGSAHWPLGRLAALLGRTDEALGHFAAAVTIDTRLGARPLVALVRLDWAGALRTRAARGDYAQARLLAWQAATEARRLDMPGPAGRAEHLVNDLDQAIRAGDPLTPREREIAELVSAGIINRAIATQLVLSERTVEGHVRSILAKLQLTNRTELAAWTLKGPGP